MLITLRAGKPFELALETYTALGKPFWAVWLPPDLNELQKFGGKNNLVQEMITNFTQLEAS